MRPIRSIWLLTPLLTVACASIPAVGPPASVGAATSQPTTTAAVTASPSAVPVGSPTDSPPPSTTPKPRKTPRPTSRATPTPPRISVDLSVYVQTADIPSPWYAETDYAIPIHVAVAVADVPNARAKAYIGPFATSFDTGALATTDVYSRDAPFNLFSPGPYELTLSVKVPPGYVDIDRSNNKVVISIEVLPKP